MNTITQSRTNAVERPAQEFAHQTPQAGVGMLVCIDAGVDDWETLALGVLPGAKVVILERDRDGVSQITTALFNCRDIRTLHIVSHGSPGCLYLGSTQLNFHTLYYYASQLQQWKSSLSDDGEILLYGCNIAAETLGSATQSPLKRTANSQSRLKPTETRTLQSAETRGSATRHPLKRMANSQSRLKPTEKPTFQFNLVDLSYKTAVLTAGVTQAPPTASAFLHRLHHLTGAKIAASTNLTGAIAQGGDWNLAYKIGEIASSNAFTPEVCLAYPGVLINFTTASTPAVGSQPSSVAVGDFNGDGFQDMAIANFSLNNSVSVLKGDGTGNFTTASTSFVGIFPISVAVGDFNGDGFQDMAIANFFSDNVTVLTGDGTGNFTTASTPAVGDVPFSVAVGDFNGDGKQDMAIANTGSNNVTVLKGDGTGNFTTASTSSVGSLPRSVAVEDFNSDGKLDMAIANNGSNNVTVLTGDGTGNFTTASTSAVGGAPESVAVGDFNGDGKQDMAIANRYSNNVTVLTGDGTGNFTPASTSAVGNGPVSVAVGDFNGDGFQDMAIANVYSDNVTVLTGDGTGNFTTASTSAVGSVPRSVAVGDFNGDGKQDMAIANAFSDNVSVLLNTTPRISIAADITRAETGSTNGTFIITLDEPAPVGGLVVNFDTTGSTAATPAHYSIAADTNITAVTATTFTIAPGQKTATLKVVPLDDNLINPGETVKVNITTSPDYILSANNNATLTITDNDKPTVTFGATTYSGTEGTAPTTVTIPITLSETPQSDVTVPIVLSGTATNGTDYTLSTTTITFPALTTSLTQNAIATINPDDIPENAETVILGFGTIPNRNPGAIAQTTLTIDANDPISYAISSTNAIAEGNSGTTPTSFTVTRTGGTGIASTIDYTIGGTATLNTDYNNVKLDGSPALVTGTINFAAGETTKTITVKDISVTLSNPNLTAAPENSAIATPTAKTTITDDDPPILNFGSSTYTASEKAGTANINVILSSASAKPVTVNYTTADNTATSNDYTTASGSLTYNPGEISKNFTVAIANDGIAELDEILNLQLNTPSNGTLGTTANASLTITDENIPIVNFSSATYSVNEGSGTATVTVNLDIAPAASVSIDYGTTSGGKAIADTDYSTTQGTLTFNAGETSKSFTIPIINDPAFEGSETVQITLTNPSNKLALGQTTAATLTIVNDDNSLLTAIDDSIDLILGGVGSLLNAIGSTGDRDQIFGTLGNDVVYGNEGDDIVYSGKGNDIVYGGQDDDWLSGDNDADIVYGDGGNDTIQGGNGRANPDNLGDRDLLFGNQGNDIINGNEGNDTIYGGKDSDIAYGGQDDDLLCGDKGADTLQGDRGNDSIFGGNLDVGVGDLDDRDLLYGGVGNDYLNGNLADDTLDGGEGNDIVHGGKGSDVVCGDNGDDALFGDLGNDNLCAGDGNDSVYGGEGVDELCGGSGDNLLNGDRGEDTLTGGGGRDRFVLKAGNGSDIITDFEDGIDFIALDNSLTFEQLSVTIDNNTTLIRVGDELLASLKGVGVGAIAFEDFTRL